MKRFLVMAVLIGAAGILGACSRKHQPAPPPAPKAAAPANSTLKIMPTKPMTAMTAAAPQTKMKAPNPTTGGD